MEMSESSVISSLREKRSELTGILESLEREAAARRADLEHLAATIGLFDPDNIPVAVQPLRRRPRNDWFRPGECRRRIDDVLREATDPMTTREIVERIMAASHLPSEDPRVRELIQKTVLGSLNRATETIERTQAAGSMAWRVI
jgi:hypothetical protein